MVVDFTVNEPEDAEYASAERRGYEQLLRRLLQLPGRCVALGAVLAAVWLAWRGECTAAAKVAAASTSSSSKQHAKLLCWPRRPPGVQPCRHPAAPLPLVAHG